MADNLKLVFTYTIAAVVIVGGGAAIIFVRDLDENTKLLLAGFIGAAIQYVFNREVATQATRAAQSSVEQGATNASPGVLR